MSTDLAVELCRSALMLALTIAGPVVIAALIIGLVFGLLQSMTQLHDQTLSFVPRLMVLSLVIFFLLPWVLSQVTEYAADLIREIPSHLY